MSITFTTANKQKILLHNLPLASGGEGSVHKIISPPWYNNDCVKVYFRKNRTRERERKIDFMVKNPLPDLGGGKDARIICWPKELVYDGNNQLAGFVMPLAFSGSRLMYELCTPTMKNLGPVWSSKYDRTSGQGVESRLKLCVNIAAAVNLIHLAHKYVLVDLKPQNLLVSSDGKVSVIDLDSIQISNNNKVVFAAQFATPEYVPVEGNRVNPSKDLISESWDNFSLAVMFYQLLFGLHPYAASFQGQYKDSTTVADSIKNGLFVFGSKRNYVHIRPELHDNFNRIPTSLQNLFIRAFDAGHTNPNLRPKADEWGRIAFEEIQKPVSQWKGMDATIAARVRPKSSATARQTTSGRPQSYKQAAASAARQATGPTTSQRAVQSVSSPPFSLRTAVSLVIA